MVRRFRSRAFGRLLWLLVLLVPVLALVGVIIFSRRPDSRDPSRFDPAIFAASQRYLGPDFDWRIFKALVAQESAYNPKARSRSGALGLCQLMPGTAADVGRELGRPGFDPLEPDDALAGGAYYLRKTYDGWAEISDDPPGRLRTRLALAAYNAGPRRVRQVVHEQARRLEWSAIVPCLPNETQGYVRAILDLKYPALCRQLPIDGPRPAGETQR